MVKSNGKRRTNSFNPAASPLINFQIKNQFPRDKHLEHPWADNIMSFCRKCWHLCKDKRLKISGCQGFKCICVSLFDD